MSAIYQDGMWYSTSSCQVDVMPTPNETLVDLIVQYVGETTQNYKNGYFYKCVSDGESTPTYSWRNVRVQEGGGGGGSDVTVTQIVDSGTKIAEIDVDGTTTDLFSPKEVVTIMKNDFAALTQEQKDNGTAYFIPDMFVENNITVVEGYYNESDSKFYEEDTYETEITGETGILYYSLDTDNKYKWDGEQFVLLVPVSGGGSGGTTYTAGNGIVIDEDEISTDNMESTDLAEIVTNMPSVQTNLPILFDETGVERKVGWYINSNGLKKPVYEYSGSYDSEQTWSSNTWHDTALSASSVDMILDVSVMNSTGTILNSLMAARDDGRTYVQIENLRDKSFGVMYYRLRYTKTIDTPI